MQVCRGPRRTEDNATARDQFGAAAQKVAAIDKVAAAHGRSGVDQGPMWGPCGIDPEPVWGRSEIDLRSASPAKRSAASLVGWTPPPQTHPPLRAMRRNGECGHLPHSDIKVHNRCRGAAEEVATKEERRGRGRKEDEDEDKEEEEEREEEDTGRGS